MGGGDNVQYNNECKQDYYGFLPPPCNGLIQLHHMMFQFWTLRTGRIRLNVQSIHQTYSFFAVLCYMVCASISSESLAHLRIDKKQQKHKGSGSSDQSSAFINDFILQMYP